MSEIAGDNNFDRAAPFGAMERKLVRAWRRERTFVETRGLCHLFLWAAVLFTSNFAIDWVFNLSGRGRVTLLAVNAVVLAAVVYWHWWRYLKRYDPVRAALEVETCYPQLKSVLVSYVQLHGRAEQEAGMSVSLVRAMCRQAVKVAGPIDFGKIVRFRTLNRLFICCLAVLLVGSLAGWRQAELLKVFVGRMADPKSTLRYPTRTFLWPVTGDKVLQEGRPFSPSALAGGEIPKEGILSIRPADGDTEIVRIPPGKKLQPGGRREFTYHMGEVYRSFTYSFRLGDAVSGRYKVTVVPPPRMEPLLTITYPAYTNRKPSTNESLTLDVLEGSQIEWKLKFDRPLAAANMTQDGGRSAEMALEDDGRVARLTLGKGEEPLTKTLSYGFRWTDSENSFTYAPAAQYTLQVVPDRPPRVALTAPSRDLKGTIQKGLAVRVTVKDDYGLAAARIVYSVEGDPSTGEGAIPETRAPITTAAFDKQPLETTVAFTWKVVDSVPDLKPGDVLRYAVEVTDNRPGTPWTTRSEMRRLIVVTPGEYVRYVAEQRARLLARIRELQTEEKRAAEAVEELKELDKENEKK